MLYLMNAIELSFYVIIKKEETIILPIIAIKVHMLYVVITLATEFLLPEVIFPDSPNFKYQINFD